MEPEQRLLTNTIKSHRIGCLHQQWLHQVSVLLLATPKAPKICRTQKVQRLWQSAISSTGQKFNTLLAETTGCQNTKHEIKTNKKKASAQRMNSWWDEAARSDGWEPYHSIQIQTHTYSQPQGLALQINIPNIDNRKNALWMQGFLLLQF